MTDTIHETFNPPSDDVLSEAIHRAEVGILARQSPDGAWRPCDCSGPLITGWGLVALRYLDASKHFDVSGAVAFVLGQQLPNGSFPDYAGDQQGSLVAASACYAGLYAAGVDPRAERMERAWGYILKQGGFVSVDPISKTFLVAAGLVEPLVLPSIPMTWMLIPGARRLLGRWLNPAFSLILNALPGLIRGLKARRKVPIPARNLATWMEDQNLILYLKQVQDPTGHWFGTLLHTALCAMALYALGVPASDPTIARAIAYFPQFRYTADAPTEPSWRAAVASRKEALPGSPWQFAAYGSETWNTALCMRALLASGISADDPHIRRAVVFLLSNQGRLDEPPEWQNPAPGAPRCGGWPFEESNSFGLDCDSTGQVLAALSMVRGAPSVPEAINEGLAWLLGMQNRDGGFPAFSWGHASKLPGPYPLALYLSPDSAHALLSLLRFGSLQLGDPSTEDLTGRVLQGLGALGYRVGNPVVDRAVAFLRAQVFDNGVWWGRWECNFLPSSAYILKGLADVGADLDAPYVRRAVQWIERHQNRDGGFGETSASYANLGLAGIGKSNPYITGLIVSALIAVGGQREVIDKAIAYLLRTQQRKDGLWDGGSYELVVNPPLPFYKMPADVSPAALQALAAYRTLRRGGSVQGVALQ